MPSVPPMRYPGHGGHDVSTLSQGFTPVTGFDWHATQFTSASMEWRTSRHGAMHRGRGDMSPNIGQTRTKKNKTQKNPYRNKALIFIICISNFDNLFAPLHYISQVWMPSKCIQRILGRPIHTFWIPSRYSGHIWEFLWCILGTYENAVRVFWAHMRIPTGYSVYIWEYLRGILGTYENTFGVFCAHMRIPSGYSGHIWEYLRGILGAYYVPMLQYYQVKRLITIKWRQDFHANVVRLSTKHVKLTWNGRQTERVLLFVVCSEPFRCVSLSFIVSLPWSE